MIVCLYNNCVHVLYCGHCCQQGFPNLQLQTTEADHEHRVSNQHWCLSFLYPHECSSSSVNAALMICLRWIYGMARFLAFCQSVPYSGVEYTPNFMRVSAYFWYSSGARYMFHFDESALCHFNSFGNFLATCVIFCQFLVLFAKVEVSSYLF